MHCQPSRRLRPASLRSAHKSIRIPDPKLVLRIGSDALCIGLDKCRPSHFTNSFSSSSSGSQSISLYRSQSCEDGHGFPTMGSSVAPCVHIQCFRAQRWGDLDHEETHQVDTRERLGGGLVPDALDHPPSVRWDSGCPLVGEPLREERLLIFDLLLPSDDLLLPSDLAARAPPRSARKASNRIRGERSHGRRVGSTMPEVAGHRLSQAAVRTTFRTD